MDREIVQAKLDIGRVISRAAEALRVNFLAFFGLAGVVCGVPVGLLQLWVLNRVGTGSDQAFTGAFWIGVAAGVAVWIGTAAVLQGLLVRSTILTLSGRPADLAGSAARALGLLLPIIGLSICCAILVGLGAIVFIFPGLMIYCALFLAVPVLVNEELGVFASMQRSRDLTRGGRWWVFLVAILLWIFSTIVDNVLGLVVGIFTPDAAAGALDMSSLAAFGVATAISTGLTAAVSAVVAAALYVELREVKEGTSAGELASVFA